MKLFAHRGASGTHPENTLAAFKEAARFPIYGIELDVHLTKDGEVVVIHDEKIDRTSNGSGFVQEMTLAELKQYDFGKKFSEQYIGETIPTLEEVIRIFEPTHHWLNIELKSDVIDYVGLEKKVLALVNTYQLADRVIISSFNHEALKRTKVLQPSIKTAPLFLNKMNEAPLQYVESLGADALHTSGKLLDQVNIASFNATGKKVRVYTVNRLEQAKELAALNIDAIFTDYPEKMLQQSSSITS